MDRITPDPHDPSETLRASFRRKLDDLDDRFTEAALVVSETMPRLVARFLAGERSSIDDARAMAARVAEAIRSVEDDGFLMIAREAPVGRDLRRLVAILRLSVDVERSAALMRHVNETLERLDPTTMLPAPLAALQDMADRSTAVFAAGIDAWRRRDGLAVNDLDRADEAVDALQEDLLAMAAEDGIDSDTMVVIGLLARYFERIADHGVALGQDVAFVVTGERVTLPSKR